MCLNESKEIISSFVNKARMLLRTTILVNLPFVDQIHLNGYMANSVDPDEMPVRGISSGYALFAKIKSILKKEIQSFLEIMTYNCSVYTIVNHVLFLCSLMNNFIVGLKVVKNFGKT